MTSHAYLTNSQTNFKFFLYELCLLFWHFKNATAYHLSRHKPPSPSTKELYGRQVYLHTNVIPSKILLIVAIPGSRHGERKKFSSQGIRNELSNRKFKKKIIYWVYYDAIVFVSLNFLLRHSKRNSIVFYLNFLLHHSTQMQQYLFLFELSIASQQMQKYLFLL